MESINNQRIAALSLYRQAEDSLAYNARSDPEDREGDLEHIGEIAVRTTLPTTKLRPCARCGGRFIGRDLYEATDWHESLMFFEGDRLCRECARKHGVCCRLARTHPLFSAKGWSRKGAELLYLRLAHSYARVP